MEKYRNVYVIAQKEFADNIWSPRFLTLILLFTIIVFSISYHSMIESGNAVYMSYLDIAQIVSLFLPFIGIVLGFDAISKEREAESLNVLLTHPVYRDNIIAGKTLGAMITLVLVVFISIFMVLGTMLVTSGTELSSQMLDRLVIFAILTYLYISVFLALSILGSIVTKNAIKSLVYNIAIWVALCIVFGMIGTTTASIITEHKPTDLDDNERFLELNADIQKLTPAHHYAMAVSGLPSLSWLGISSERSDIRGIFDTKHTLEKWWNEFWMNILILVITPVFLIIMAFIMFLRQDVSKDMG